MTADNDIDGIFEKHSVKEIENLLSKMRNDIERKKEDLRIMVGERYRDLIEAADTIADMRESADAICGNVLTVERLCESLQQRGLIGFKTRVTHHSFGSRDPPPTSPQYSLAIQVKLLVDVPEILWGLAERRQYLDATQLFLLAQQAHTALQLSPNASEMLDKFPVISRQWSSISQFRSTITRGCISLVRDEVEDLQLVLEAVAATVLLEGKDATEALRATLQLRRDALATCLQRHDVTPSAVAMRTLPAFVTLCVAFLRVVDYVFSPGTNGEKCRLEKLLLAVSGEATEGQDPPEPPINLLYESSLGLSFLPKAVVEFRPKLRGNLGSLSATFIHEEMKQWMASAVPQSSKAVGKLLSCTTSMKALSLVRGAVWEAHPSESDQRDWNLVTERVLGSRGFSPWETVVRLEALARARILLKKELEKVCENVLKMVKELAKEIKTNARACSEEGNVSEFIWSESMSDLPDQVAWASMGPRNAVGPGTHEKMGLFYKSRGYTRRIQTVCKALNSKMAAILEDVSCYAPDSLREDVSPTDEGFGESAGASEDYDALLQFLQQETVHVFKGFLVDLEAVAADGLASLEVGFETEDRAGSLPPVGLPPSPGGTVIVTASRLSQAIPLVCPQLKICAGATLLSSKDTARRVSLGMQPDTQSWVDLVQHFHQNSSFLMATFLSRLARIYVAQTKAEFTECFRKNDPESLLRLFASWDKVQIEEESETGSKVESSISIPAHPSPPLSAALANIGSSLNAVCAHTVTRKAQGELVTSLTDEVLSMFEEVTPAESGQWPSQAVALQFLFDLKLIQNMLLPREQKEMGLRMVTLIHLVEGAIDPFDLDVFSPHLSARVKMASQRLLVLLGPVIPRGKQPYTARGTTWSSGGNNTLPIVPSLEIPRFSNVPLAPSPHPRKPSLLDDLADPLLESHLKVEDERYPLVNPPVFVDVDNGKDFENVVVKKEVMEDFNESSVISEVHRALASCLPNTSEDSLPEWSNDETSILIDIWEEHIIHFRKYGRNDDIYQQIADRLQIISCTKHKRTAREIKYKLEMLKRIYKANQKKASKKGLNHVKWKFYNKIEKFLHPSPFYETPIPIESCILNTSQDSSPEWSNDETNVLIDLWEKHIIYLRKYGRNVNINRQIAEELQDILQTRHKRTAREIKDKLEMLKRIYNANKKKVIRKGLSRPKWKFYSKIEKVLHPSPLFDPSGRSDLNAVNLDMSGESVSQKEVDAEPPVEMPLKCILQEGEASIETSLPACTNGSGFQDSSSLQKCQSTSLLPNQTSLGDQKSEFTGLGPTQTSLGDQKPQLNSSPENPFSFFLVLKPQPNSIPDNQASLSVQNSQFTSPATDQNTHLTSTQANQTSSLSDQKPESTSLLVNRTSNGILKPGCPSPPGNQIVSGIQKLEPTSPPGSQTLSVSQKIECTSPPGNLTFSGTHTPESPGSPGNQTFYGIEKHEAPSPPRNQTLPGTQKLELTSPPCTQQPESTSPPTPRRKTRNRKNLNETNLQLTPDKTERRTCNCGALFEKQITENRNMYERLIMVEKETNKSNMKELMIMEKEKSEKVADDLKELLLMEKTRNDRLGNELQELNQKLRSSEMKLAVSENERERWQENERKWENEREQWVRKEERLTEEIEKWKRKASSRIELEDWKAKMGL